MKIILEPIQQHCTLAKSVGWLSCPLGGGWWLASDSESELSVCLKVQMPTTGLGRVEKVEVELRVWAVLLIISELKILLG